MPATHVEVTIPPMQLQGDLRLPSTARGTVIFAHGSGSSRFSPRNQAVAEALVEAGLAALLLDLLTDDEAAQRANVFDIDLLTGRVLDAVAWTLGHPYLGRLPIGLFGASTGAAAALKAAAARPDEVAAVVSRGGRPDLAGDDLDQVAAPTLLIVGGDDEPVLTWNREARRRIRHCRLAVVPGATHLFEEPGALEAVTALAKNWFADHLRPEA
ncbi:MAG: dienelactone hydrolase family protein [Caulobacteraceae bacterium]